MERYQSLFEEIEIDFSKPIAVSTKLLYPYSAFSSWQWIIPYPNKINTKPVSRLEIATAIENKEFIRTPIKGVDYANLDKNASREDHIRRIAYMVIHKDSHPIHIDVGLPGYSDKINIEDGNHRLAAAIFRKDKNILVEFSGDLQRIKEFCTFGYFK